MTLSEMLYAIEGEALDPRHSTLAVTFIDDKGREFEFAQASSDGEIVILNIREVSRDDDLLNAAEAVLDSECGVKSMSELAVAVKRHGGTDFTAENPDPDDDDPRRIEAEEEARANLRDIEDGYTP